MSRLPLCNVCKTLKPPHLIHVDRDFLGLLASCFGRIVSCRTFIFFTPSLSLLLPRRL